MLDGLGEFQQRKDMLNLFQSLYLLVFSDTLEISLELARCIGMVRGEKPLERL